MRYIVMHKVDAKMEAAAPPDQEIIVGMGTLVRESIAAGVFENGAGLHRSARRVRVEFRGGARTVTHGPFTGKNELIWSVAMVQAPAMEGAIELAERYAGVIGDCEIEIGPVVEAWDLGLVPEPARRATSRFLLLVKGSDRTEASRVEPGVMAGLAELEARLREEGILLMAEKLAPSASGARLAAGSQGKRTWVDGPFAESKELIAGFSIVNLPSLPDAQAWGSRYADILDGNEVDIRELQPISA